MDRATAIAQIAVLAINVLGQTVATVRGFLKSTGATEAELDAAIDAVVADATERKKLSDAAAGR